MSRGSYDSSGDSSDRLSNLPRDILHHILSFLDRTEVTKTCVLSKTFLSTWGCFHILDFDNRWYGTSMLDKDFLEYVNSIIQWRTLHHGTAALEKFRLYLWADQSSGDTIDEAICFAINNNVKELVLDIRSGSYPMPEISLCRSIILLTLSGLKIANLNELLIGCPLLEQLKLSCSGEENLMILGSKIKSIDITGTMDLKSIEIASPALQSFSYNGHESSCSDFVFLNCSYLEDLKLEEAPITDSWIQKLLPDLLQLEGLQLSSCYELKNIKISNVKLKRLVLELCHGLEIVDVQVVDLESFSYYGLRKEPENHICKINIIDCKHLKHLDLFGGGLSKDLLHEQVPKLLELNSLKLNLSSFEGRLEIRNKSLKHLEIRNRKNIFDTEVKIYTPRLCLFSYEGSVVPFVAFDYKATLNAALDIVPEMVMNTLYFVKWYELIRCFAWCKVLTFDCNEGKGLIFPRALRKTMKAPLVGLKHMRIDIHPSSVCTDLVDSLLWLSPYLETLVFVELISIKLQYERMKKMENTLCGSDKPIQGCIFKTVEIEIIDEFDEKANLLKYFKEKAKYLQLIKC